MALETATYVSQLVAANPLHTDNLNQADGHLRLIKSVLQATFPNITGAVTGTQAALNAAAALQPSGAGSVMVPNNGGASDIVMLGATTGTDFLLQNDASTIYLNYGSNSGGTWTTKLSLDVNGNLFPVGYVAAPNGFFTGTSNSTPVSWVGEVRMHSGSVASIPTGWHLCDGTSGTPDLRDKFVVGAGNSYAPGATGGAASVTLSDTNLPAHTHGISDPGHTHNISDPGHVHGVPYGEALVAGGVNAVGVFGSGYGTENSNSAVTGVAAQTATTGIAGTESTGGSAAFPILPPYYALCFVMRIV